MADPLLGHGHSEQAQSQTDQYGKIMGFGQQQLEEEQVVVVDHPLISADHQASAYPADVPLLSTMHSNLMAGL